MTKKQFTTEHLTPELKQWLHENAGAIKPADGGSVEYWAAKTSKAIDDGSLVFEKLCELTGYATDIEQAPEQTPNPHKVFAGAAGHTVRVKGGSECYRSEKSLAKHRKYDVELRDERNRPVYTASELENAKSGALYKHMAARAGLPIVLTEHDQSLMHEMETKDKWVGLNPTTQTWEKDQPGSIYKTLASNSTSGGIYLNPEFQDTNIVTIPLIEGEIVPFVRMVEVPRGAAIEGSKISNVDVSWGTNEPTAIGLFNDDNWISQFTADIHVVSFACKIGRDMFSDSVVNIGATVNELVGMAMRAELDKVLCVGDGVTQPEGLFTASGLGSVNALNGASGPPALVDYEGLLFGVSKAYRGSGGRSLVFVSNDVSYRRSRAIQVDPNTPTVNQTRVLGMNHENYETLGHAHRINPEISNRKILFGDLYRGYRLYRRLGLSFEWHTQGESLARSNSVLLVCRGRFGGLVVDPNAFAVIEDGQS